jgi:hypothetical protein
VEGKPLAKVHWALRVPARDTVSPVVSQVSFGPAVLFPTTEKTTDPIGVPEPGGVIPVTVAVNVTGCPATSELEGLLSTTDIVAIALKTSWFVDPVLVA